MFFFKRLPPCQEVKLTFLACVFPVHAWAILIFLSELSAYLRRMDAELVFGVFAYSQAAALIESIIITFVLVLLATLLPGSWLKEKFLPLSTVLVYISALWLIPTDFQKEILQGLSLGLWGFIFLIWIWFISYILVLSGLWISVRRSASVEKALRAFIERLTVLALFYVAIAVMSIAYLIYRNII